MSKQRYEKEIEEILQKYEQDKASGEHPRKGPERPTIPNSRWSAPPTPSGKHLPSMPNWKRLSAGQYMMAAFGVALLAVLLRGFAGGALSTLLIVVAALLFLLPIVLYRSTGTTSGGYSPHEEKRWRGQVIDFNTRRDITDDPLARVKRWFRRR